MNLELVRRKKTASNVLVFLKLNCSPAEIAFVNANDLDREKVVLLHVRPGFLSQKLISNLSHGGGGFYDEQRRSRFVKYSIWGEISQAFFEKLHDLKSRKSISLRELIEGTSVQVTYNDSLEIELQVATFVQSFHAMLSQRQSRLRIIE